MWLRVSRRGRLALRAPAAAAEGRAARIAARPLGGPATAARRAAASAAAERDDDDEADGQPEKQDEMEGLDKGAAALSQMLFLANAHVPEEVRKAVSNMKSTGPMSLRERTVAAVIKRAEVSGVEFNVMHETGFELDIVAPGGMVCELDGPSHRSAGRQRIAELQRRLFAKRGIIIHRVDIIQRSLVEVVNEVADNCTLPGDAESKAAWQRVKDVAAEAQAHAERQQERLGQPQDLWIAACHWAEGTVERNARRKLRLNAPVGFGTGAAIDAALREATGRSPVAPVAPAGEWEVVWPKGTAWRERPDWDARVAAGRNGFVRHQAKGTASLVEDGYVRDARTGWWLPLRAPDGNELIVVDDAWREQAAAPPHGDYAEACL